MRLGKRMTMVLALLLSVIGADVCAQEVVDSVWVDSVEVDLVLQTHRSMLSAWSCRESISCRHRQQWCQIR